MGALLVVQNFTESKELTCLNLYKDINEIARTSEMALSERETVQKHKDLIFEYVENDCPDFEDLVLRKLPVMCIICKMDFTDSGINGSQEDWEGWVKKRLKMLQLMRRMESYS